MRQPSFLPVFFLPGLSVLLFCFACGTTPVSSPQLQSSPELQKSLAAFEIAEGFRVELMAAEPLVADPVAMEIDENGVWYVVEMHGYPLDLSGSGVVKLLKDTDGDGFPDKSVVFADSLVLPTGVMKWQNGVLVTDPPFVWYLEDRDGDDRADIRRPVLTGFALSNPQHNLNSPVFGLDNWIYLAHQWAVTPLVCVKEFSDEGTEVYFPDQPGGPRLPRNADDRNVRFRPDTYQLETLSGNSQFGHTFDPWGHQLMNENAHHLYHEVIADRYLRRNPHLLVPDVVQNLPDHGDACTVYPITENPQHQLLTDVGIITSACGVTWYQGGAFPAPYNDHCTFVAEPVHNLIHADKISDRGATFTAGRIPENRDFLASRDPLFRPCAFYTGPDGALYVVDYYRPIIEHPEWMSEEVNRSGRLYEGSDKGRIYRIVPEKGLALPKNIRLGDAPDERLLEYLDHPNIWYRRTAQRLLYQRKSVAKAPLQQLARQARSPEGRVHALWLLDGLGFMDENTLDAALRDPHPGVRENAIRASEAYLGRFPALQEVLPAMAADPDAKVRYQLLCTLGFLKNARADAARLALLKRDLADPWVQIAALTAAAGSEMRLFQLAIREFNDPQDSAAGRFFALLAATVGNAGEAAPGLQLLQQATEPGPPEAAHWKTAVLEGLGRLWAHKGVPAWIGEPERKRLQEYLGETAPPALRAAAMALLQITGLPTEPARSVMRQRALHWATAPQTAESLRVAALQWLALDQPGAHRAVFGQCIAPSEPEQVQLAALEALGAIAGTAVTDFMLERWNGLTPALKDRAIDLCLHNPVRMHRLLDAVAAGRIRASSIGWPRQVRLMNNDDLGVRDHARKVLTAPGAGDRQQVVARYKAALEAGGDAARGEKIFDRACRQCHQLQGKGVNFGPDLASIRNRDPQFILADILDPNRSIADAYEFWTATLKNGPATSGLIASETSTSVTFKDLAGQTRTIARSDIRTLQASNVSVMPEGLENSVSVEQMRDLLVFLKKGR